MREDGHRRSNSTMTMMIKMSTIAPPPMYIAILSWLTLVQHLGGQDRALVQPSGEAKVPTLYLAHRRSPCSSCDDGASGRQGPTTMKDEQRSGVGFFRGLLAVRSDAKILATRRRLEG